MKPRPEWLLDGKTPVVELGRDTFWDGQFVLVAFSGTRQRKWVEPSRLLAYSDVRACPAWKKAA